MSSASTPGRPVYHERSEIVQEEIRRRILAGEMAPGSSIPETELAESLGVSRGPVREALRALEAKGLVSRQPRRTAIVMPVTKQDVDEIYSLRAELECLAIRIAIERNHAFLALDLQRALKRLEAAEREADGAALSEADISFHGAFYRHSGHSRLTAAWDALEDPLRLMMRMTNDVADGHPSPSAGHEEIATSAIRADIQGAQAATRRHLDLARARLEAILDRA